MAPLRALVASALVGAAAARHLAQAPPPLPEGCAPFGASNYSTVECFLALLPGQVYRITTSCDTVKGDTVLRLRDPYDIQVAYNDDSSVCAPTSASSIDYVVPCRYNAVDVRDFVLIQGCFGAGACEATTTVAYSPVMKPLVCGAPPPQPPAGTVPPPPLAAPPAPPLPAGCAPYGTKDDKTVLCFLSLSEGYTYRIFTDCPSVKGDTDLLLLDDADQVVAFNDNFPFCGDDAFASLIEYFVPCGDDYNPLRAFKLRQGCGSSGGSCGAHVLVEYSDKVPPVICPKIPNNTIPIY